MTDSSEYVLPTHMTWYSVLSFSSMCAYKMPAFFLHMYCYYRHKRKLLGLTFWTTLYKSRQTANIGAIARLCKYTHKNNKIAQRTQTPPRPLQCRPLVNDNINANLPVLRKVKKWSISIITDLYSAFRSEDTEALDPNPSTPKFNHLHRVTSPLVHAYHVWLTSWHPILFSIYILPTADIVLQ